MPGPPIHFPQSVQDPGVPTWTVVDAATQRRHPHVSIGLVECAVPGAAGGRGTCWLAGRNTALTAAHVVRGHDVPGASVRMRFPGVAAIAAMDVRVPDQFGLSEDVFDPWDVAVLRLPDGARAAIRRAAPDAVQPATVVGFPSVEGNQMVTSAGPARQPGQDLLLHKADSEEGHSGCAVLQTVGGAAAVVAIHIGNFSANPFRQQFPKHNVALLFRPELAAFIDARIAEWG